MNLSDVVYRLITIRAMRNAVTTHGSDNVDELAKDLEELYERRVRMTLATEGPLVGCA